jgi:hypothetical protein
MLNIKGMNKCKEIDGAFTVNKPHGDFSPNARETGQSLISTPWESFKR